jgi:hypothetical protein
LALGAGITLFPPDVLAVAEQHVDRPGPGRELAAILHRLESAGTHVGGQSLRRTPSSFPADHERAPLLRQLGLRVERLEAVPIEMPEAVVGPVLPELLVSGFQRLEPVRRWLMRLEC